MVRLAALSIPLCIVGAGEAMAGAFNPDFGRGVAILTTEFASAPPWRETRGRGATASGYRKSESTLHVEIGLADWLAAIVRPRLVATRLDAPLGTSDHGLGASEFGLQARILRSGGFVLAAQALARIPGGRRSPLYDRGGGGEARLMAGHGFDVGGKPAFAEAHVAWRRRDGGRMDEVLVDMTLGWRPLAPLLVMAQTFTTIETSGPRGAAWTRAQATLAYDVTAQWSVSIAGFVTVTRRRAPAARGWVVGLWRRF